MLPMYPAYGSSAESEGDGQPPSDSERRRWYAGCPNLFLELSRCAPVTGAGQTAHDLISRYITGAARIEMGLTGC